jgi:hypothetical protein
MHALMLVSNNGCFLGTRCYSATDARTLRAAVGALYDLLGLAARTLEAFGPADSQEKAP